MGDTLDPVEALLAHESPDPAALKQCVRHLRDAAETAAAEADKWHGKWTDAVTYQEGVDALLDGVVSARTAGGQPIWLRERVEKMIALTHAAHRRTAALDKEVGAGTTAIRFECDRADRIADENRQLREALTWAVGFIRCNLPQTAADYPDMRNAEGVLAAAGPVVSGEFHEMAARADLAEFERDKAWAELKQARESVDWWQRVAEAKQDERDRYRAAAPVQEARHDAAD